MKSNQCYKMNMAYFRILSSNMDTLANVVKVLKGNGYIVDIQGNDMSISRVDDET